jgi:rod shape-determining protein MreC
VFATRGVAVTETTSPRRATAVRLLLIWLLLETVAAAQVAGGDGHSVLWSWLHNLARPFLAASAWTADLSEDLVWGLRDHRHLIDEVQRTRRDLELSRARNILLREDIEALREAMTLRPVAELDASSLTARCTFRSLARGRMQVDAGLGQGVHADTAVLAAGGLVGRVVRRGESHSWVELITHPAAAVAVRTLDGQVEGLAAGSGGDELQIQFVPRWAPVVRGEVLVTSGAAGIYPPGITVARVVRVRESDNPFLEITALPVVNLATVRVVVLLPEWAPIGGEEGPR